MTKQEAKEKAKVIRKHTEASEVEIEEVPGGWIISLKQYGKNKPKRLSRRVTTELGIRSYGRGWFLDLRGHGNFIAYDNKD